MQRAELALGSQNYRLLRGLVPDIQDVFHYRRLCSADGLDVHLRSIESNNHYRIYTIGQYALQGIDLVTVNEFTLLLDPATESVRLIGFNDRNFWFHVFQEGNKASMSRDLEVYFNTWLRTLQLRGYHPVQLD